jgi:hypothetical protein
LARVTCKRSQLVLCYDIRLHCILSSIILAHVLHVLHVLQSLIRHYSLYSNYHPSTTSRLPSFSFLPQLIPSIPQHLFPVTMHASSTSIFTAIMALIRVALATPPACLLSAMGYIAKDSKIRSYLTIFPVFNPTQQILKLSAARSNYKSQETSQKSALVMMNHLP